MPNLSASDPAQHGETAMQRRVTVAIKRNLPRAETGGRMNGPIPRVERMLDNWGRWVRDGGNGGARSLRKPGTLEPIDPYDIDQAMEIDAMVAKLVWRLKLPVCAYYCANASYREIAKRLRTNESTLKSRIYAAQAKIEQMLQINACNVG